MSVKTSTLTEVIAYSVLSDFLVRCKKNIRLAKKKRRKQKGGGDDEVEWEKFLNQKLLEVWRRPINSSGLYEYKGTVIGIKINVLFKISSV